VFDCNVEGLVVAVTDMAAQTADGFGTAWRRHWGLTADPFDANRAIYVALPSHEEAAARLLYAIESAEPRSSLIADGGMGKTTVLRQVIKRAAAPNVRIVAVESPPDEVLLLARLAEQLGQRRSSRQVPDRGEAWRLLDRAVRLHQVVGCHVVLAIDECHRLGYARRGGVLQSLHIMGEGKAARLTVLMIGRPHSAHPKDTLADWPPAAGIEALTRSEVERYIHAKLAGSGCSGHVFTTRALTRLHALSQGVPRVLEQLATLSLMAGALRRAEVVTPELVEGATRVIDPRPTESVFQ
jgi:type II secretory pathway predicted ATPase ExeA